MTPATTPSTTAITAILNPRKLSFIALSFLHRAFGNDVFSLLHLHLDATEAEAFVGLRLVPRQRRALRLRTCHGQGEDQGLGSVVRNMSGHVVMLLVNMAIEDRDVGVGQQK